jgi:chemotaxis protein MotB
MARRAKSRGAPAAAGAPLWMVTFSDMVTLLLTFFVMLMATANFEDVGRVEAVLQSIRTALAVGGYHKNLLGISKDTLEGPREIVEMKKTMPVTADLTAVLENAISRDLVRMTRTQTEVRLAMDPSVFFPPGQTELHPAAFGVVVEVANILENHAGLDLRVEGHSDGSGTTAERWNISTLRATAVAAAIDERGQGLAPRIDAVGRGAGHPMDSTPDSPWNRRVELVFTSREPKVLGGLRDIMNISGGGHGG